MAGAVLEETPGGASQVIRTLRLYDFERLHVQDKDDDPVEQVTDELMQFSWL